jgi:hypothetical protein
VRNMTCQPHADLLNYRALWLRVSHRRTWGSLVRLETPSNPPPPSPSDCRKAALLALQARSLQAEHVVNGMTSVLQSVPATVVPAPWSDATVASAGSSAGGSVTPQRGLLQAPAVCELPPGAAPLPSDVLI